MVFFLAVIAFNAVAIVLAIWWSGGRNESAASRRRWGRVALVGVLAWMGISGALPATGLLQIQMLPPPPILLLATCLLLALMVGFSSVGARLSSLPLVALISFHGFRLPLELVLHRWYQEGVIPIQMTYDGHNFDIATGVLALAIGLLSKFRQCPIALVWLFNLVGLGLLITVVSVAVLSVPTPMRQYDNDPPVLLPFYFPYIWIVTMAVTPAAVGHIVLFRRLLQPRTDSQTR